MPPNALKPDALFMAPMTTWSGEPDLTVSDAELVYYERRARNVDYVITACIFVDRRHQGLPFQFFAGSDDALPSLTRLASAIHRGGASAILQVHSAGRMVSPELQQQPGIELVSASAVRPERDGYACPRALTVPEIEAITASYGYDHVAIGTSLLLNPDWRDAEELVTDIREDTIPSDIPANLRDKLLTIFAGL